MREGTTTLQAGRLLSGAYALIKKRVKPIKTRKKKVRERGIEEKE